MHAEIINLGRHVQFSLDQWVYRYTVADQSMANQVIEKKKRTMRLAGKLLSSQHPDMLRYDIEADKLWISICHSSRFLTERLH